MNKGFQIKQVRSVLFGWPYLQSIQPNRSRQQTGDFPQGVTPGAARTRSENGRRLAFEIDAVRCRTQMCFIRSTTRIAQIAGNA